MDWFRLTLLVGGSKQSTRPTPSFVGDRGNQQDTQCEYAMIRSPNRVFRRTLVEMAFIIFLFYSNLLMGQYNVGHDFVDKPILLAITNIVTLDNFMIAVAAAFIGHIVFDSLRKRL